MAVVASTSTETMDLPQLPRLMDRSPSKSASESSSLSAADASDPNQHLFPPASPNTLQKEAEAQSAAALRSEEYRQLFRLLPDEVLVEDFNCAFQENLLIQGHMYLFVHHICFYSNIFGFETKKIIPFKEVTDVRRAKTAGIFPNAIEIVAGNKKYFFASFISRDEAFKIITDGWLQHSNDSKAIVDQQEPIVESSSQENSSVVIERVESYKSLVNELDSADSNRDAPGLKDPMFQYDVEKNNVSTTVSELTVSVKENTGPILDTQASSSRTFPWKQEDSDAPKVPDSYSKVAESKFPIKVEDFFTFFFSDDAYDFIASFHERCGDKDFKCSSWYPHVKFGYARDVSFQHPIKIYFGAKTGGCREIQKFRVYRNSHLVIETSQEVSDVPYADYFRVEGLWDVEKDPDESSEGCIMRVYINVAFSKRTVWKGKIVQSTVEECREAYAIWVEMAHELLKKKNLEKQEGWTIIGKGGLTDNTCQNDIDNLEKQVKMEESSDRSYELNDHIKLPTPRSSAVNQQPGSYLQGVDTTSLASTLRESAMKSWIFLKSQHGLPLLLVIIFGVILLMQLSIVVLLARPQHIHVSSPDLSSIISGGGKSSETMAWLEKRLHHLKDEMYMVEARLERMRREHALLMGQLKDLEYLSKRKS